MAPEGHAAHFNQEWRRKHRRDQELAERLAVFRRVVAQFAFGRYAGFIARVAHGFDELLDAELAGRVAHGGLVGGEVDARLDALELVEARLDARRAGRAGHPLEVELYIALGGGPGHARGA